MQNKMGLWMDGWMDEALGLRTFVQLFNVRKCLRSRTKAPRFVTGRPSVLPAKKIYVKDIDFFINNR